MPDSQNPYRCSDGSCVLLVPGEYVGMHTNGGCQCLDVTKSDFVTYARVRKGVRYLANLARRRVRG